MTAPRLLIALIVFALPLFSNGNCQSVLSNLPNGASFTLSGQSAVGWVFFSSGTIRPNQYIATRQLFSDRLNGNQPFAVQHADKLGILLDSGRSQLQVTLESWGRGRSALDLYCFVGGNFYSSGAFLTGRRPGEVWSLFLKPLPTPPGGVGTTSQGLSVSSVPHPTAGRSNADMARDILRTLGQTQPGWFQQYAAQEPRSGDLLAYRLAMIETLLKGQ